MDANHSESNNRSVPPARSQTGKIPNSSTVKQPAIPNKPIPKTPSSKTVSSSESSETRPAPDRKTVPKAAPKKEGAPAAPASDPSSPSPKPRPAPAQKTVPKAAPKKEGAPGTPASDPSSPSPKLRPAPVQKTVPKAAPKKEGAPGAPVSNPSNPSPKLRPAPVQKTVPKAAPKKEGAPGAPASDPSSDPSSASPKLRPAPARKTVPKTTPKKENESGENKTSNEIVPARDAAVIPNRGPIVQKYPPRDKRLDRPRRVPTETISRIYYKLSQKRVLKKYWIHFCAIVLILALLIAGYMRSWESQAQTTEIIHAVDAGITALMADRLEEARTSLQQSLDIYRPYHMDNPKVWWKRDANLFVNMLKSTQGWRSLGDYKTGLMAFEAIARHNTDGPNSWVGEQMETELKDFFDFSHWNENEMQEMYLYIQELSPSSWDPCGIQLIRATERLGLFVVPMADRLKEANFIVFGTPQPMKQIRDDALKVNVIRFYSIDSLPETISLALSPELSELARLRLHWYSTADRKCLIFATNPDQPTLDRLEDIVLSEPYSVDVFNQLYK